MIQTIQIGNLKCLCCKGNPAIVTYILYPTDTLGAWIEEAAEKYGTSIAVITGMDWENDLTPWPAPGVPTGTTPFKGTAPAFLETLQENVLPLIEEAMGIHNNVRDLVGVSLSGLFTLWQWAVADSFRNIASLSGSFWYEGFASWFSTHMSTPKNGRAYFLLGNQEGKSPVPQFRQVVADTQAVVDTLRALGIQVHYDTVPGNHYQHPIERLDRAFGWLYPAG